MQSDGRHVMVLVGALAAGLGLGWVVSSPASSPGSDGGAERPAAEVAPVPTHEPRPPARLHAALRWVAFGGGAEPSSSQVSIEQDLALAAELLGREHGLLLHAGGAGAASVQVLDEGAVEDGSLRGRLGELFAPSEARLSRYRASEIEPDGPATLDSLEAALRAALVDTAAGPLLLYGAGHGDGGEERAFNTLQTWGATPTTPAALASLLDAVQARPLVLVLTSCFSGGFSEIIFEGADENAAPAQIERCGLFASTWDREASGCDPNPDRAAQEGFALHFLNALRGADRQGVALPAGALDLDGDGDVSLLEAHARARMMSRSIDVPTTTSERWLRHAAPPEGPRVPVSLPVEDAVVAALERALGLSGPQAASARLAALEQRLDRSDETLGVLEAEADDAWLALRIHLLERWPTIDDPWDRRFGPTLAAHEAAIWEQLDGSAPARRREGSLWRLERAAASIDPLFVEHALALRLVRANENRTLAERLRAVGGASWAQFERLRRCEGRQLRPRD